MKPLLIVANFKSHLTHSEAKSWLETFSKAFRQFDDKKVVLCPPFTLLQMFKDFTNEHKLSVELGAQNISRLPQGPYTGEVNGAQIKDFANYVIVGHSERRQFGEDESVVEEKIKMSLDYSLIPILCVQIVENKIPGEVSIIAYEPTFAIGTGNSQNPADAEKIGIELRKRADFEHVIYGGSVSPDNVSSFTKLKSFNGVLVGTDSLDPEKFLSIVRNA